jgi:small subunit ribosomal protein S9
MDAKDYFNRQTLMLAVRSPLVETGTDSRYDVIAAVEGGGKSGQAGAVKHGVARALVEADPSLKTDVKRAGHLSRDARMVERKKAGLRKARKRPQFSKR